MKLVRRVARPQGTFSFHADRKTMQAILKIIQEQYNVKFDGISCLKFDPLEAWADGGITLCGFMGERGDEYLAHIGVKARFMQGSRRSMLSDLDVTRMLVSIGNLTGRLEDMLTYMRMPNDPVGLRLATETIATIDNFVYYALNHLLNECELRAERNGLVFAQETLMSLLRAGILQYEGYESADMCVGQALVDYVNFRIDANNDVYFALPGVLLEPFSTLADIVVVFDAAIERSAVKKRICSGTRPLDLDVFFRVVGMAGREHCDHYRDYGGMFVATKTPYEQNLIISVVTAFGLRDDGYGGCFAKWFPALRDVLPMYSATDEVDDAEMKAARHKAFYESVYNAFAGIALRAQEWMPKLSPFMPKIDDAFRAYGRCYNLVIKYRGKILHQDIPGFFTKIPSDDANKHAQRGGPSFDTISLNFSEFIKREKSEAELRAEEAIGRAFETVFPRISQQKDTVAAQSDDASESE